MFHMASCSVKYNHHELLHHNPLKSSYDARMSTNISVPSNNEDTTKLFEVEMKEIEGNDIAGTQDSTDGSDSDDGSPHDLHDNDDFHNDLYNPQAQLSTAVSKVQIKLNNLINNHKASLKLHDDIVVLFNDYIASPNFDLNAKLKTRKSFIKSMESSYGVTHLRPMNTEVLLHDQSRVTVPVFDVKSMILDLLTDQNLMINANIAEGYDLFSGDVDLKNPSNQKYSEVHTGDEWLPARDRYCSSPDDIHNDMPVALIIFGDKSHTDLHGALALTPIIFTLTLFNRMSRNNPKFWRPLAYLPNLGFGKNKADKTPTKDKIQNEHECLSIAFKSIRRIHQEGGFHALVLGREVHIKIWVHYFIGDTEGNNKWLGHYPGQRQVHRPYRDCQCDFNNMSNPNPTCVYTTLRDMRDAKRLKRNDENLGLIQLKQMSRYDIKNALTKKNMPLSDNIHGPYCMMPPELLHTSGSGLILYMFESLQWQIGGGKIRDDIDKLHIRVYMSTKRQSERDFPRGAIRNGIIDGTKCQSEERKGNLFLLLCIANTTEGSMKLQAALNHNSSKWKKLLDFIKLYLSMEEWFHDSNDKEEVNMARPLIAKVLKLLQWLFPREENTNGYCIPKMHGMAKFQFYIKRYGSAMNFYGGTGESAHKQFVKAPGQKTQRRVSEFASQTASQFYDILVTNHALRSITTNENSMLAWSKSKHQLTSVDADEVSVELKGKYNLRITDDVIQLMKEGGDIEVDWHSDKKKMKKNNSLHFIDRELVQVILKEINRKNTSALGEEYTIEGYTRATTTSKDGNKVCFYAHPYFQGRKWYDWAYVHFEEINVSGEAVETYYPSKILGFVTISGTTEAIIQCSEKQLVWNDVQNKFMVKTQLGTDMDISYVMVPITALVHPLCVIPDTGGDRLSHIIILPKRNWSRYFGDKILSEYNKSLKK